MLIQLPPFVQLQPAAIPPTPTLTAGRVNSPRYSVSLILYSRPENTVPWYHIVDLCLPDPPGVHGSPEKEPLMLAYISLSPKGWKGTDSRQPPPFCEFLGLIKKLLLDNRCRWSAVECWGLSDYYIVPASMALEWELCEYTVSLDCGDRLLLMAEWKSAD